LSKSQKLFASLTKTMRWYQLFVIIFGLLMLYLTFLDYKKKVIRNREYILFSGVWLAGIALGLVPQSAQFAFQTFKVIRILDLVTIVGISFLTSLVYYIYTRMRRIEKKLEDLTRKDALKHLTRPPKPWRRREK